MAKPPRVSRRVTLTPRTAKRVARAVLKVEGGNRDMSAPGLRGGGGEDNLARGTFTGTWTQGQTKTVNDAVLTSVTYTVKNYQATLTPSGTMPCLISYVAGEWVLVAWDWTMVSGWSGAGQQILGHNATGALVWLNTTTCQ
jgi:hypothetical protein